MLVVDSREHWTQPSSRDKKLKTYFDRHNILYRVEKLDVGDYMLDGGSISVDRKQDLEELAKNLTNRNDNARFMREVRRAWSKHIRLVVLIEARGIKTTDDVLRWRSDHTIVNGSLLIREMFSITMAYGVQFEFCDPNSTGRRIMEILTGKGEQHEASRNHKS